MAVPFSNTKLRVPKGFQNLLEAFAKEVLRQQPANVYEFGAVFFEEMVKERERTGVDDIAKLGAKLEDRFYNMPFKRSEAEEATAEMQEAALKIQTEYRRHQAAVEVEDMREQQAAEHIAAAGAGLTDRSEISAREVPAGGMEPAEEPAGEEQVELPHEDAAATKIQAAFRGHLVRKSIQQDAADVLPAESAEVEGAEPAEGEPGDEGHIVREQMKEDLAGGQGEEPVEGGLFDAGNEEGDQAMAPPMKELAQFDEDELGPQGADALASVEREQPEGEEETEAMKEMAPLESEIGEGSGAPEEAPDTDEGNLLEEEQTEGQLKPGEGEELPPPDDGETDAAASEREAPPEGAAGEVEEAPAEPQEEVSAEPQEEAAAEPQEEAAAEPQEEAAAEPQEAAAEPQEAPAEPQEEAPAEPTGDGEAPPEEPQPEAPAEVQEPQPEEEQPQEQQPTEPEPEAAPEAEAPPPEDAPAAEGGEGEAETAGPPPEEGAAGEQPPEENAE